jgi:hypothetical protein
MGAGLDTTKHGFELPMSSPRPNREAAITERSLIRLPHSNSTNNLSTHLGGRRSSMTLGGLADRAAVLAWMVHYEKSQISRKGTSS